MSASFSKRRISAHSLPNIILFTFNLLSNLMLIFVNVSADGVPYINGSSKTILTP